MDCRKDDNSILDDVKAYCSLDVLKMKPKLWTHHGKGRGIGEDPVSGENELKRRSTEDKGVYVITGDTSKSLQKFTRRC